MNGITTRFNPLDLVLGLASTVDLVSTSVANHHLRVAYIASRIGSALHHDAPSLHTAIIAAALHDIGALTVRDKLDTLAFEIENPFQHCELGYRLLSRFEPFAQVAEIVRYHHVRWANGHGARFQGQQVPEEAFLLHLADRIEVLIERNQPILDQVDRICNEIAIHAGKWFIPLHVDAFRIVAKQESFWLDLRSNRLEDILKRQVKSIDIPNDLETMTSLTRMLSFVIDFQSRFTATHSSGVAAVADALAAYNGYDAEHCALLRMAGYLHDLGKMTIPDSILEKPGDLNDDQKRIMRTHTYYTLRALERIEGFEDISKWAAYHHERIDGNGYPFHLPPEQLCAESRLMAVADFFTALTENRPYRKGMAPQAALGIMRKMVTDGGLDGSFVELAGDHLEDLNAVRSQAQEQALTEYKRFHEGI